LNNFMFIELSRRGQELYYHKQKYECDFLLKQGTSIQQAFQICYRLDENNR